MATEAEAREVLIEISKDLLNVILDDLGYPDEVDADREYPRPITGVEIEDIVKKLYRVSSTLKTAQSLSPV